MINLTEYVLAQVRPNNCNGDRCLSTLPQVSAGEGQIKLVLAIVIAALASIAVAIIVLAAVYFANSEGDPQKISNAKQTIVYALVGLVIALLAEFIVLFVVGEI